MKYIKFETERLIIRPVTIDDARAYIENKMLPQLKELGYGNYTVIRKADKTKIGTCGLYNREGLDGIDIGFAFLPKFHGQGYAYESAKILKDAAFSKFNIQKLRAITMKENKSSQKLLEKLGLAYTKNIKIPNDHEELMLYEFI